MVHMHMSMCHLGGCLYNLREDPLEMVDLANEMPIKADILRAKVFAARLPPLRTRKAATPRARKAFILPTAEFRHHSSGGGLRCDRVQPAPGHD